MTNEDSFRDMPMIRIGRDANPGVGRPSKAGVTAIKETRTKTDKTIARRTHTSRSTSRPIERNDNKRSAQRSRLRLCRTEMQERCDAKETRAHDAREEVRRRAIDRAECEVSDRGDRERRGAEQSARQPEEFSEARRERERRLLDVVRRRNEEPVEPGEERVKADDERQPRGSQDIGGRRGRRGRRHGPHRPGPVGIYVSGRLSPLNFTPRARRVSDKAGMSRGSGTRSSLIRLTGWRRSMADSRRKENGWLSRPPSWGGGNRDESRPDPRPLRRHPVPSFAIFACTPA